MGVFLTVPSRFHQNKKTCQSQNNCVFENSDTAEVASHFLFGLLRQNHLDELNLIAMMMMLTMMLTMMMMAMMMMSTMIYIL